MTSECSDGSCGALAALVLKCRPGMNGTDLRGMLRFHLIVIIDSAGEVGSKQRMKKSYNKEIANHIGPESCEGGREAALEALTGGNAGRVIEPRNQFKLRGADAVMVCGRPHGGTRKGESTPAPARSENHGMHGRLLHGSREIPWPTGHSWEWVSPHREPLRG